MACTRKCNVSVLTIYPEPTFPKSWIHCCKHHTFQTSHEDPLTPRPPEVAARCPVPVPSPAEAVVVSAAGRGGGRRAGLPDTRPTRPPRPLAPDPSSLGPGPHTPERNNRIYSPPPPPTPYSQNTPTTGPVNVESLAQHILSCISRRVLDARKYDLSVKINHFRVNRINCHMRENLSI